MPNRKFRRPPRKSASHPLGNFPIAYASTPQEAIVPMRILATSGAIPLRLISAISSGSETEKSERHR